MKRREGYTPTNQESGIFPNELTLIPDSIAQKQEGDPRSA